jgi:hypothetical protein
VLLQHVDPGCQGGIVLFDPRVPEHFSFIFLHILCNVNVRKSGKSSSKITAKTIWGKKSAKLLVLTQLAGGLDLHTSMSD